ncbi:efflux RND transporter periplasmic adaptor subunit [Psychrobacter vallis]|uniref:efflux RND transporter periplasmic adaptor subunit n=1 Tax=Psychrobacter vallis TaxID=248451 RepID=UPI00191AD5F0|nr:HlyD family efflux transporter periplasmic adaptor subunit [Psychrobacter vallis]
MTASKILKNSIYLLSALLLAACQPSPPTDEPVTSENSATVDTPVIITADSVTMTPDHILSIKPSRYQPSLGLQGRIEPIKQTKLIAAHPLDVEKVLVTKGQWVEKGMPLVIVRRLATADIPSSVTEQSDRENALASDADDTQSKDKQEKNTTLNSELAQPTTEDSTAPINNTVTTKSTSPDKKDPLKAEPATNDNSRADTVNASDSATNSTSPYTLVTVRASFSGRVEDLYIKTGQTLTARTPLLRLSDETQLHFIATLPIQAEPQLSVGQTVNFTAEGLSDKFTGQVSKLTATSQPKKLLVYVEVVENKTSRDMLMPDMKVTGRVDYGQIDVGTVVPKRALHDVDLTELQKPPYKPLSPLTANVWIIGQDQRLIRRPIEVVEYSPITDQYLIAGISNDSLICLADLPVDSKGKKVIVS